MANRTPMRSAPPPHLKEKANELSFEEGDILYVVDQNNSNWWLARQDKKEGLIPSSYVSKENIRIPIVDAARRGNLMLLNDCLSNGISVNSLDKTGSSALHAACMSGHMDCVQRLLREAKVELNLQNKLGDTPLHNAAIKGHHEICELLLSRGSDLNILNRDQRTPRALARSALVLGTFDEHTLRAKGGTVQRQEEDCSDQDSDDD